jgi:Porin PorA
MRARQGWGIGLSVLGVLCLVAAAVLAWVVVPARKQLPADTDTTRQFEGTARFLLNTQALTAGDLRAAVKIDAPVTATRTVKVQATDGGTAEVADQRQLAADGQTVGQSQVTYAVDRTSLEAATPPSGWQVTPHEGLTVSFPIDARQQQYTGWVNETQTTTPIQFQREESKGGVNTYVYTARTDAAPIKDPQVLASLPLSLPISVLSALAGVIPLSPEAQAALAKALPGLADPVQLNYTYQSTSTYWVEPTTGIVVDSEREEIRKAGINAGAETVGGLPVYDVSTKYTADSVAAAADQASDARNTIEAVGSTLPWVLGGAGVVLLIAGLVLVVTGRRRTT